MFENIKNVVTYAGAGYGRQYGGKAMQATGFGIRKVGEALVMGGTWLENKGAEISARGEAARYVMSGQFTKAGLLAVTQGKDPIEAMAMEILSGTKLTFIDMSKIPINEEEVPADQMASELS